MSPKLNNPFERMAFWQRLLIGTLLLGPTIYLFKARDAGLSIWVSLIAVGIYGTVALLLNKLIEWHRRQQ